jgi:hypothetical protein
MNSSTYLTPQTRVLYRTKGEKTIILALFEVRQNPKRKLTKYETKTEDMGTAELRSNLHKIVDRIEDERLLRAIYSFLNEREKAEEGKMWNSLTEEQKKEVLRRMTSLRTPQT